MTERFAILLMLGAIPLFFVGSYPAAFAYLAAFNAVAWSAWAWDRAQIKQELLAAARDHKQQWILDQPQGVVLQLTSTSGFAMTVDVRESLPATVKTGVLETAEPAVREADFTGAAEVALVALGVGLPGGGDPERLPVPRRKLEPEFPLVPTEHESAPTVRLKHPTSLVPQRIDMQPHQTVRLEYALTPTVRGELNLGTLTLRMFGPLGLAFSQRTIDVGKLVEVVPALPISGALGAVEARPGGDAGSISSRVKGSGVELESLREYVAGDEFRKISWKATARRGRTMVKETVQEVSQQVVVLMDVGRRMFVSVGGRGEEALRADLAMDASLLICRAALQQGDKVGFWSFADTVRTFLKPGRGRKQWVQIGQTLQRVQPNQSPTDYVAAVNHLLTIVRRRSLVILITEPPLGRELESMKQAVGLVGLKHRSLVLCLQDPQLAEGADPTADRRDVALRRSAAADILAQRRAAVTELGRSGVMVLDVPPAELTLPYLQKMLKLTKR
jgi:uncharacterized protein (DUF58 family)